MISLEDRIHGALLGAAIGAELGFSRIGASERFAINSPMDIFKIELKPSDETGYSGAMKWYGKTLPFIDLGMRAYIIKQGRVTAEDFGDLLKDDLDISAPVFFWDPLHTTQEILKEGMNPRISGMGNVPCGYIVSSMPAVGIYHFADPEYAYIDGVELASVTQPRIGADWAGLSAAAIASAFLPDSTPQSIIDNILKIAHENCKDLFYQLNIPFKWGGMVNAPEEWFINNWYYSGTETALRNDKGYAAFNPLSRVLPLLHRYGADAKKLMAALIAPPQDTSCVSGIIAGSIIGALHGSSIFCDEWQNWANPLISKWMPFVDVIKKRKSKEKEIISIVNEISGKDDIEKSMLFDKVYGCILAGAIGNAMGSPVENQNYTDIDSKFPDHVTTILNTSALENEDDNQMAMMLIETYLDRSSFPVTARHFGETWKTKMNRDKFFVNCMGHCYDLIRSGWDSRITGHWTQVTGSTVMCMEPVGIYNIADPENAYIDAKAISYMYQRGLDNIAASLLAGVVAESFRPQATVDSVCQTAIDLAPDSKLNTFDKRKFNSVKEYINKCIEIAGKYNDVLAVRKELYDECLMYASIDPLEVIGFSLAIFKTANGDVRQAAIGGTNIGRDSDTISGRAAMLSGIVSGAGSVPQDWVNLFKPHVLDKIKKNSLRLTELIINKNNRMKIRSKY